MRRSLMHVTLVFVTGVVPEFAMAQPTSPPARFHTTVSWVEVATGTLDPVSSPNGVLEPGESALMRLSLEFSPGVGQLVRYWVSGVGWLESPVAGFSDTYFSAIATGAGGGTWTLAPSPPEFPSGLFITLPETGSVLVAGAWQPFPAPGQMPNAMNPLPNLWAATWTPPHYTARTAEFRFQSASPAGYLFAEFPSAPGGFHGVEVRQMEFGVVNIPIAPAPASCLPFLALGFTALRRTRRRT
ncbi:MAG: hypothetical protein KF678_08515 [Phycisphaeraceae bacterium]|nr:hypothetical protein [Phycisphaeraceae bacterium]